MHTMDHNGLRELLPAAGAVRALTRQWPDSLILR